MTGKNRALVASLEPDPVRARGEARLYIVRQIKTDHGAHPSLSSRRASLVSRQHHVCRSAPRLNSVDDGVGVSDGVIGCLGLSVTFTAPVSID